MSESEYVSEYSDDEHNEPYVALFEEEYESDVDNSSEDNDYKEEPVATTEEGYEYETVGDVCEDFKCPVCLMLLRDAMELPCSHTMCDSCTRRWTKECRRRDPSCPKCNKMYSLDDVRPNRAFDRIIRTTITVRCEKSSEGCQWTGMISNVKDHDKTCQFAVMKCDFRRCGKMVKRCDMESHRSVCQYRKVDCEYCEESFPIIDKEEHYNTCSQFPTPCPLQGCNDVIQRLMLENHISKICLHQTIKCEFEPVGCNAMMKRGEAKAHDDNNVQAHMRLLLKDSMASRVDNGKMKVENEKMKEENEKLKKKIKELECNMKKHEDVYSGNERCDNERRTRRYTQRSRFSFD